jgi:DNA-binding transcriptional LysR family regulator
VEARQISYFLAVVEHGGFGRAASALHVAQPTLSQSVRALERELGTELFHRAARGVVLTAAGHALIGPARQLVRDLTAARSAAGGGAEPAVVDLVAAAPLGVHPGAALVGTFRAGRPDVLVRMDRADPDEALPALVRDGSSELGLTYLPIPQIGLVEMPLGSQQLVLAFPPRQPVEPGPVALSELSGESLISVPSGSWHRELVVPALRAAGTRARIVVETTQRDAVLGLVLAGVGTAFLVDCAAAAAAARGAQVRPIDPPLRRSFGLIHGRLPLSEPAAAFVAHARAWSAGLAGGRLNPAGAGRAGG